MFAPAFCFASQPPSASSGQYPVVGTTAFEMVSNGVDFKVFLNSKNLFEEGSDSAPRDLEEQAGKSAAARTFSSSMLIRPGDPATEKPALVDATDEDNAFYILYFVRTGPNGEFLGLARGVWFDRIDLSIARQTVYDESGSGAIVSDTRYSKWQPYNGVMFPAHIDINRPKDRIRCGARGDRYADESHPHG